MTEWIRSALDVVLILVITLGLIQASRLIRQLSGLKQNRVEMERFVQEFNSTVIRAENGIKNLKQVTRDSGDDLEKLLDKAHMVRDELRFIVESADQLAARLANSAAVVMRPEVKTTSSRMPQEETAEVRNASVSPLITHSKPDVHVEPSSRAEKELLQALQKLK